MAGKNDELVKIVNDLVASCRDSQEGFLKAAKGVHDDELRRMLTGIANQHEAFAAELQGYAGKLDAKPAKHGHGGGVLASGWVDLEQRIRPKDDPTFLVECRKGEDSTVKHFEHALDSGVLPEDIRSVVERQCHWIQRVMEDLRRAEVNARTKVTA